MLAALFLAGLLCNGVDDDSAAWTAALAQADQGIDKTVELPAGTCVFKKPPTPITRGINVEGQGKSWTVLRCDTGSCIQVCDMGSTIRDLTLWAGPGTQNGVGLLVTACGGRASGNHVIEHMWITSGQGGGTWGTPLHIDGSLRTQAPMGMRTVVLNDVSTFAGSYWSAVLWNCVGCEWRGGGAYGNIAVGGPMSVNIKLDIIYNQPTSVIWPGVTRP